jgi:hypothetical protein
LFKIRLISQHSIIGVTWRVLPVGITARTGPITEPAQHLHAPCGTRGKPISNSKYPGAQQAQHVLCGSVSAKFGYRRQIANQRFFSNGATAFVHAHAARWF